MMKAVSFLFLITSFDVTFMVVAADDVSVDDYYRPIRVDYEKDILLSDNRNNNNSHLFGLVIGGSDTPTNR